MLNERIIIPGLNATRRAWCYLIGAILYAIAKGYVNAGHDWAAPIADGLAYFLTVMAAVHTSILEPTNTPAAQDDLNGGG